MIKTIALRKTHSPPLAATREVYHKNQDVELTLQYVLFTIYIYIYIYIAVLPSIFAFNEKIISIKYLYEY